MFVEQRAINTLPPRWLKSWKGDGVISRLSSPTFAAATRTSGIAAVDLTHRLPHFGLPRIVSDDWAIGRLAAEHLVDCGLRSFGFCGYSNTQWSERRREGFLETISAFGSSVETYESPLDGPEARSWEREQACIARWLKGLAKPVGIMACNDIRGLHVLDACRRDDFRVPEDVAVIGVDDDPILCELCDPPLSSIIPNPERIGYEAAELLDQLMNGATVDFEERLIPPRGLAVRTSTDLLSIEDVHIVAALRFIRANACRGISVQDVLDRVQLSRSALEQRFRKYVGRSPQAEIRALQIQRVKQLLTETDFKLNHIAELAGFQHPEYLSVLFKREVGLTPGQYRRGNRPLGFHRDLTAGDEGPG